MRTSPCWIAIASLVLASCGSDEEPKERKTAVLMAQECEAPALPVFPAGRDATEDQIFDAHKTVRAFISAGHDYIECVHDIEGLSGDDVSEEKRELGMRKQQEMEKQMQLAAKRFNAQLREFKRINGIDSSATEPSAP